MTKLVTAPKITFPPRPLIGLIIKRYLREDTVWKAQQEFSAFYRLYKLCPNQQFWETYDLGFKLRSLVWFFGATGKTRLKNDFAVFSWGAPQDEKEVDKAVGPAYNPPTTPSVDETPYG